MPSYQPGRVTGITGVTSVHQGMGAGYAVSLSVFEGPLDLLLHLIEQEELDISEISLVAVTDQYLQTLEQMEELVPGALADFLVVASRLLYIKSTRLLPKPVESDEDEEDAGATLVRHLLEYRQFKRVAETLHEREHDGARHFVRPPAAVDLGEALNPQPDFGELEPSLLQNALQRALQRMPVTSPPPTVEPYSVTVAERMESIRRRIASLWNQSSPGAHKARVAFSELLEQSSDRLDIIVTFLAVLELMKQRVVTAKQDATFGEILLAPPAVAESTEEIAYGAAPEPEGTELESEDQ